MLLSLASIIKQVPSIKYLSGFEYKVSGIKYNLSVSTVKDSVLGTGRKYAVGGIYWLAFTI